MMRRGAAVAVGLALALGGVALMYTDRAAQAPRHWEQVEGVVLSSAVKESDGRRFAEIQFEYEVGGQKVLARQLHFAPGEVDRMPGELPRGKMVTVWFDPMRPEQSRLMPGERANWRWPVAAAMLGAGLGLALHGLRRRRPPPAPA
jgi:hypothetical protein